MDIEFEKPMIPNFIRTDKGLFPLNEFNKSEIEKYIKLWSKTLREKYSENVKKINKKNDSLQNSFGIN